MFVLLAAIFASIFSTGMMGYLSMSTQLGPWIAPIFIVVVMLLVRPYLQQKFALKYSIAIITASSLGGMIGMCLGFSFPSFFFLHQKIFKTWLASPIYFSCIVASFIIAAAIYAFVLGYIFRHYFLVEMDRKFPMSQLVYDVLYGTNAVQVKFLTIVGIVISFIMNRVVAFAHVASTTRLAHINMYPLLASVGFISGQAVAIPILIGLMTRVLTFRLIHIYIPSTMTDQSLVITFSIGMLIAWFILNSNVIFLKKSDNKYWRTHSFLLQIIKQKWFWICCLFAVMTSFLLLWYWNLSIFIVLIILMMVMLLALYGVDIISTIGIIEVNTYVSFVLFGMIYFIPTTMASMIAVSVLATLCIGIVINLLFSYKLANLADVDYRFVTKYQIIGVVTSIIFSGILFWYFCTSFSIQSYSVLAQKTYQFEDLVKFSEYKPKIILAGILYGAVLHYISGELLAIIGGILMDPIVAAVLVASGAFANMIKNREKIYPVFLGIYAGHMLWLLLTSLIKNM